MLILVLVAIILVVTLIARCPVLELFILAVLGLDLGAVLGGSDGQDALVHVHVAHALPLLVILHFRQARNRHTRQQARHRCWPRVVACLGVAHNRLL